MKLSQSFLMARIAFALGTGLTAGIAVADNSCPAGFPLDCGNGTCCPAGNTLYCPQMEPTPCFDPSKLTDEQLKTLEINCQPLLSCR